MENERQEFLGQDDSILAELGLIDPGTGAPAAREETRTDRWETEDNPYFKRVKEIERQQPSIGDSLEAHRQQLRTWADEAYQVAVRNGMPQQIAYQTIGAELRARESEAELVANRQATLPMARRQAAEGIAKEFSDKQVVVNPDELIGDANITLEGMRERAKGLRDERRKFKFDSRRLDGRDRVESGPAQSGGLSQAYENLSSTGKIRAGLLRGDVKTVS